MRYDIIEWNRCQSRRQWSIRRKSWLLMKWLIDKSILFIFFVPFAFCTCTHPLFWADGQTGEVLTHDSFRLSSSNTFRFERNHFGGGGIKSVNFPVSNHLIFSHTFAAIVRGSQLTWKQKIHLLRFLYRAKWKKIKNTQRGSNFIGVEVRWPFCISLFRNSIDIHIYTMAWPETIDAKIEYLIHLQSVSHIHSYSHTHTQWLFFDA